MLIILTTTDKEDVAMNIAETLINKKLAACLQIIKVKSIYFWNGKKEEAYEYLIMIKTSEKKKKDVEKAIKELSNYSLPEIVYIKGKASKEYERWIKEVTKNGQDG